MTTPTRPPNEQRLLDMLANDQFITFESSHGVDDRCCRRAWNAAAEHTRTIVREWLDDLAMEREARRFAARHDEAFARVSDAMRASFVIDEDGCNEVLL